METKKPWQSKTVILNSILGLLAAVSAFVPGAEPIKAWIMAHAIEIGMFWSIAGIALRAITKDKIILID